MFFFFFSSRRRHTRWTGDWSSDVCSSDLDLDFERAKRRVLSRHSPEHVAEFLVLRADIGHIVIEQRGASVLNKFFDGFALFHGHPINGSLIELSQRRIADDRTTAAASFVAAG